MVEPLGATSRRLLVYAEDHFHQRCIPTLLAALTHATLATVPQAALVDDDEVPS